MSKASCKVITDVKVEPGYIDAVLDMMDRIALEVKVEQAQRGEKDEENPA